MNWKLRKIGTTVAVIAALLIIILLLFKTGNGSALRRYKAALRAKGEKLTFKELAMRPSTNTEEVAALKVLAGYSINYSPLSSSVSPITMDYVAPGRARIAWRGELHSVSGSNWAVMEWKTLENDKLHTASALAEIRPALLISPPDSGWVYDDIYSNAIGRPSTNYVRDRIIAQALQRDLLNELHGNNLDAALNDLHALAGQIGVNRNELTLVSQMIRVAIAGLTLNSTWEALQAPGWDEARLASLQKNWERVEFLDGIERAMLSQRAFFQVVMTKVRHSNGQQFAQIVNPPLAPGTSVPIAAGHSLKAIWTEQLDPWIYRMTGANKDELVELKYATALVEAARQMKSGRPWLEINGSLTNLVGDLNRSITADRFHQLRVSAIAIPNYNRMFLTVAHAETLRRLTITAIALKRYQLKHGSTPPELAALVPEFLSAVPIDPMSGKALCYRLKMDGTSVLYSVGEDGKDDGGQAGMGLWAGLDAVWPVAATPEEQTVAEAAVEKK